MKLALIRTIGILIVVLLLGDAAACIALLVGFHHRKIETEQPEAFRAGRIASAPLPALPIAKVSLTAMPPRPAEAEPPVVAVPEEAPVPQRMTADVPDRPRHASPLRMKSMITHAGQN